MRTVKHTLADPTWWPFVICSSPALFAWIIWKLHLLLPFCWRRTKGVSQQTPHAHPDPLMFSSNDTKLLNHKMNRWCESWILNTEESITVCFKTVNSSENRYLVVTKNWIHLCGGKEFLLLYGTKEKALRVPFYTTCTRKLLPTPRLSRWLSDVPNCLFILLTLQMWSLSSFYLLRVNTANLGVSPVST